MVQESEGRHLAGIEVKAAATVTAADFRGLKKLRNAMTERFSAGMMLYDGEVRHHSVTGCLPCRSGRCGRRRESSG